MVGWTGPARRTWTTAALIFRWWEIAFCATDFQVLSHNGFDVDKKMATVVSGIDVILSGHTHDALPEPVLSGKTIIVPSGSNGKFVGGALCRRERDLPGPSLQLSSDAAAALGVQAGSPTRLRVTALRREQVPVNPPEPEVEPGSTDTVTQKPVKPTTDTEEIAATALASLAKQKKPVAAANKPPVKTASATPAPKKRSVSKPYVQIGFFSVESNAKANVANMKANGIPAKVVSTKTNGKTFYRVLAGPAGSGTEQKQLLDMVKTQGFSDAYLVKG